MACSTVLATACELALQDREATPGACVAGGQRLFAGASQRLSSGESPATRCLLTSFARRARGTLPGGYTVGEYLFYVGACETHPSGGNVVHGQRCKVLGPAASEERCSEGLRVKFEENAQNRDCLLTDLSREAPGPLAGGYAVGEQLFYIGTGQAHANRSQVKHGQRCEVTGAAMSETAQGKGLCVRFEGDTQSRFCLLASLSREAPGPLPGGYTVGEQIFYTGASQTYPNGDRIMHGQCCEVVGPALSEALEHCRGRRLRVRVEGCERSVGCWLANLSREAPEALPGGYSVGEQVYSVGSSQTYPSGDQLMFGQRCEVAGPATSKAARGQGLCVRTEGGGRRKHDLPLASLSREAPLVGGSPLPPLPGGYAVGERIFYVGTGHAYANGDKIAHGQECEVAGPAGAPSSRSRRLSVKVAGCQANITVSLTQVSRAAP